MGKFLKIILSLFLFINLFCINLKANDKEEELFFVAQKAFDDGFYDVSLRYLERFLKEFPETNKRAQVNLLIGQCYFFSNEFLKALDQFTLLLNSSEGQDIKDSVIFWLGEVYLKGKDYKQAESFYKRLIEEFPKSSFLTQAYYSLGWTYFYMHLFEESIQSFTRVINISTDSTIIDDANFKIAECLYNLKRYKESQDSLEDFIKKYPNSMRLVEAYFYLGESAYYQEKYLEATQSYSNIFSTSTDNRLLLMAKVSNGWANLKLKRLDLAEVSFNEAEALAKNKNLELDDVLLGKASLYSYLSQFEKSIDTYDELISQTNNPQLISEAMAGKADCLFALGKYDEAIKAYQDFLNKFPNNSDFPEIWERANFGIAWSYLKVSRLNEAIETFQNIAKKTQDKTTRLSALCQTGDTYQDMGDFNKSLEVYDSILKDYPDSLYSDYIQFQEGIVLLKLDMIEQAVITFQGLKKNFPKSKFIQDAKFYLGSAYFKKGNFNAAIEQLESLVNELTKEAQLKSEALFLLGVSLGHAERFKEAVTIFERVKKDYFLNEELIQKTDFEIANTLFNWGKEKEALKRFKLIVYKWPKSNISLESLLWLGRYYLKNKEFEIARGYFQDILTNSLDTKLIGEAHFLLGKTFFEEKRFEEAKKEYAKIEESDNVEMAAKVRLDLASILYQTGNSDLALKSYEETADKFTFIAEECYLDIAEIFKNLRNYNAAIDTYQKILNLTDNYDKINKAQILFSIADTQELKGDWSKAIESYLQVSYLYPKETYWLIKSYLRVARIFEDRDNWQEAKKIYEKIATNEVEEAKFAQERLDWINQNIKN